MRIGIALVVAVARNGVIGARGGLPWRVKADLKRFRAVTMGKPLVMGRRTFDSIGRVLDGRDNIVITRQSDFAVAGVLIAASLEEALAIAEERAVLRGAREICVIGGGEIFRKAWAFADRLYVTEIAAAPEGDTWFPEIVPAEWIEVSREDLPASEGDTALAAYVVYERRG